MDDLTTDSGDLSGHGTFQPRISDQTRDIRKWQAMARMIDPNPDVLPFSLSTTEPERRWAFFTRAAGIVYPALTRTTEDGSDMSEVAVTIF